MPIQRQIHHFLSRFLALRYEEEEEFQAIVLRLARRGLLVLSVSGIVCVVALLVSYAAIGKHWGWRYGQPNTVVLWDKLFLIATCFVGIGIARTGAGAKWGRRIVAVMVFAAIGSIVIDDVAGGDISFSTAYVSLVMLAAAGMMPYRPLQVLVTGMITSIAFLVAASNLPVTWEVAGVGSNVPRFVFLLIVTFVCTGLSSLLYNRRYEQHKANSRAEFLKKRLERAHEDLKVSFERLTETQDRLLHAQKMASLGRLSAGIAHELKNPLNFVNNFSELNTDLTCELLDVLSQSGNSTIEEVRSELDDILDNIKANSESINLHGRRADGIVQNMMQHAKGTAGWRQPTAINSLLDEYIDLAYSSVRSRNPEFEIDTSRSYDEQIGKPEIGPHDVGQVFLSLLNNAFDAVLEQSETESRDYRPAIDVSTKRLGEAIEIRIADNGTGVSDENRDMIFEPFFTTKPTGTSTGLGLSLAYDIVTQGYGGTITFESKAGEGSTFVVMLPV